MKSGLIMLNIMTVPKNLELVTDGYFYRHIFFKSETLIL